jgi:hypothetical protein
MLLPARIVEVNAVGDFVILMLKRGEKLIDDMFFRPIAEHPSRRGQNNHNQDRDRDLDLSPPRFCGIVRLRVEQGHKSSLSIADFKKI